MRKLIESKHLGGAITVDTRTGKQTKSKGTMHLMPAKDGTCEECATDHEAENPHNAQSLFYQYYFFNQHGRWPNWKDAMAHCTEEVKVAWTGALKEKGVRVDAGDVNTKRKKK